MVTLVKMAVMLGAALRYRIYMAFIGGLCHRGGNLSGSQSRVTFIGGASVGKSALGVNRRDGFILVPR